MKLRQFSQVDVFTGVPYRGNPLAVVLDANGLDDQEMRTFARWTNLSETTFLLPPEDDDADYRVDVAIKLPQLGNEDLERNGLGTGGGRRCQRQQEQQGNRLQKRCSPFHRVSSSKSGVCTPR